jgi:superfamily II DNA or RNA helicase
MNWEDVLDELDEAPLLTLEQLALGAVIDVDPMLSGGVRALERHAGARTLADLAHALEAEDILRVALPRQERRAFFKGMSGAIRKLVKDASPAPPPAVPREVTSGAPPRGGPALESWAAERGVTEDLEHPVRMTRSAKDRQGVLLTLREMLDVEVFPYTGKKLGFDRDAIRQTALPVIMERVKERAPDVAKRAAFLAGRRMPEEAWLRERMATLKAALERLPPEARGATPLSRQYPLVVPRFEPRPPTLRISMNRADNTVDLATGSVTNRSEYWHGTVERHELTRALLECAMDALSDPKSLAVRAILEFRSTPAHEHLLAEFRRALAHTSHGADDAPDVEVERVAYRLSVQADGAPALPIVLLQRMRKNGCLTPGRKVEAAEALHTRNVTLLEREILELCVFLAQARYTMAAPYRSKARLFELLSEHPRVHLDDDDRTPVRIRRARCCLRVRSSEAGYRFELAVGGVSVALGAVAPERLARDRLVTAYDARSSTLHFAELDDATLALIVALRSTPDALTTEGVDAVLGAIAAFPDTAADLDLPEEVAGAPVTADARLIVQLTLSNDGSIAGAIRVRPIAGGPALVPGTPPERAYGTLDGRRVFAVRDLEAEEARAARLVAELSLPGVEHKGRSELRADDAESACELVATLGELAGDGQHDVALEWSGHARLRVVSTLGRRSLRLRIDRKRDWFGISGGAEIDGKPIGIHALIAAARSGRRYVKMDTGDLVAIDRALRGLLTRASDVLHETKEGSVVAQAPALSAVEALVENEDEQLVAAKEWLELRARVRTAETSEPELPEGLRADLRPYQLDGYRWLMRLAACESGGCLADDMGLGKTLQSLAVLAARSQLGPALVVAPTSVCANWVAEAVRFTPELSCALYRGPSRRELLGSIGPRSVLITSYDILLRDIEQLATIAFATAIFDEAHVLKNANAKRSAAVRRIEAAARFALSGTPIENHTGELWSLFRVIVPGLFGSWERFRERFAGPIERDRDPARRAALASIVRPYLLRRTKAEVAPELPPRTEIVHFVTLSTAERELYEAERQRAVASTHAAVGQVDGPDARFAILAALTRLRQLACHPRLRDPASTVPSSKLASVLELLEELREAGHRALVFSQFTAHLDLVAEALSAKGFPFFELQGSTPAADRAECVRRFQAGEGDFFLVSLKAGGTGLNLTAADYVLHLDPWWNPAAEDQASDRAHRIGQDKPVTVVRLIARGTIEESVLALHGEKRELAAAILAGGDVAGRLSTADLFALMQKSVSDEIDDDGDDSDGAPEV